MSIVTQLATALEPWKTYWADHEAVSTAVTTTHVVCVVVAAGLAIASDRMTLRMRNRAPAERAAHVGELRAVHRPVLFALVAIVVTGVLMATSDIEEFFENPVFWVKMGLIVLLLLNGLALQRTENRMSEDAVASDDSGWARLTLHARMSVALWLLTTIAGMILAS